MLNTRIKELRKSVGWTQRELATRMNVSQQTIGSWEVGRAEPNTEALKKLAELFGVTVDYLINGDTQKKRYFELREKEKNDIAIQAERLIEGIENGDNTNYYGEPATQGQKDRLLTAIRTAMEMNKEEAKKKFTRKDYRD